MYVADEEVRNSLARVEVELKAIRELMRKQEHLSFRDHAAIALYAASVAPDYVGSGSANAAKNAFCLADYIAAEKEARC